MKVSYNKHDIDVIVNGSMNAVYQYVLSKQALNEMVAVLESYLQDNGIIWTVEEALKYLKISRSNLYKLMKAEKITSQKVGGNTCFYKTDVLSLIKERKKIK